MSLPKFINGMLGSDLKSCNIILNLSVRIIIMLIQYCTVSEDIRGQLTKKLLNHMIYFDQIVHTYAC